MPGDSERPCRFVTPFRGGNSTIQMIYAGIGSDALMDDIVPFREVNNTDSIIYISIQIKLLNCFTS